MNRQSSHFRKVVLPANNSGYLPDDIAMSFPSGTPVAQERLHLLAYIPWNNAYLERVPRNYQAFFKHILPHLGARTTNVHTATCLAFLPSMIEAVGAAVDERVVYVALALHDCGWSLVGAEEIADSLDYKGLSHTGEEAAIAKAAKERHDILGYALSRQVLAEYAFEPALSTEQKEQIATYIRHHTFPRGYRAGGDVPMELRLVCDTDRLWSYSHENFWQDTIRKDVDPQVYAYNLAIAIDGYFLTEAAKVMARDLLLDREAEVAALYLQLERRGGLLKDTMAMA